MQRLHCRAHFGFGKARGDVLRAVPVERLHLDDGYSLDVAAIAGKRPWPPSYASSTTAAERCRRILSEVDDAEQTLSAKAQDPSGVLRVTAPVLFGQLHVAPAVAGFLGRHRRMQVELVLLDRVVNLVEEGIDVAVRIGALADSTMVAVPVGQIRRVVVASPALLRTTGKPRHRGCGRSLTSPPRS